MNFYLVFIISLLFKLIIGCVFPLSFDEAYYWVWSHHLQLSYFDHPGFVSWLLWLGHPLETWGSAVRIPAIIFGHFYLFIWFQIFKTHFYSIPKSNWFLFCLLSPLLGIGTVIVTPDLPLLFFWSLAFYFLLKCLQSGSRKNYFLFGSSLGLGFCSKYHIVLFVLAGLIAVATNRDFRNQIVFKNLTYVLIGGLLFSSPVLIWNIQNHFHSFVFQAEHGFVNSKKWEWQWSIEYLLGQILLVSPFVIFGIYKTSSKIASKFPESIIHYFIWPVFIFFFLSTFRSTTEPNWPLVAHLGLAVLGAYTFTIFPKIKMWYKVYWVGIYGILFLAMTQPQWHWSDKLREPTYYNSIIPTASNLTPLYAESYQMASKLWFELKRPIYKLRGMSRADFYDFLGQSMPNEDRFYVIKEQFHELPQWLNSQKYHIALLNMIPPHFEVLEIRKK